MDIRKMYCRVDSEHFEEFIGEIREEYSDKVADDIVRLSKTIGAIEVSLDGWMDECGWHESNGYTEFTGSWSIYSNTKPLSELTDEQAAELFNWWRNGGKVEYLCVGECNWLNAGKNFIGINAIYRAKQKSERELFIEACTRVMRDAGTKCPDNHEYFGILFDSEEFSHKAPKRGE